jgi:hypothetical protein
LAGEAGASPESPGDGSGRQAGEAEELPPRGGGSGLNPRIRTPLFEAHHSERYARQNLTAQYEDLTGAALIVVIDQIFHENLTYLEELLFDCAEVHSLHVLLASPGG